MQYLFKQIAYCNMCGSDTKKHAILGRRLNHSQGIFPQKKKGISVSVARCTTCGLIYANPQPIPFDIQDHYGVPPESYWKENYFTVDPDYFRTEIKQAKSLLPFYEGMKALDIGAGIGKAMIAMRHEGFDAYGIEPSIPFFERAISKMGIEKNKIKNQQIENIDYPENFFDFISFGAVLEHLYDPSAALATSLKCLKPNGLIHIEVPSSKWLINKLINLYHSLTLSGFVGNLSPMHVPFHMYEFSLKSFEMNATKLHYTIAHHEYYVCETTLPGAFDFILRPIMARTHTGMQLCVWLRKVSTE
ncbi:MAG: class I SAM-dependent methyltransferase [Bacteroidetes bacterium]|nr:class I SAM-dependent methyltransferase [Bacteroidota bacterium]